MVEDFVIRIVVILISISMLIFISKIRKDKRIGNQVFVITLIFWSIILMVTTYPPILNIVQDSTPLDRNAQFLLILSVIIILYLLLVETRRSLKTSDNLHQMVRNIAISNFKHIFKNFESVDVLVIICAKNEANTIGKIIDEIKSMNFTFSLNILVINDGSTDDTGKIAREKGSYVIDHVYNLGIGAAIKTGFIVAKIFKPKIVISIDADGQHDPKYIPEIISKLDSENVDLVYASRFSNKSDYDSSAVRLVGNKFYTNLVKKITNVPFTDVTSGYRGIKFSKLDSIVFVAENNFAIELAIRAARNGLKISEIPIQGKIRKHGMSQFHRLEKFVIYNTNAIKQIYNAYFKKPKIDD